MAALDDAVPFSYKRLKTPLSATLVEGFFTGRKGLGRTFREGIFFAVGSSFSRISTLIAFTGATSFRVFELAVLVL